MDFTEFTHYAMNWLLVKMSHIKLSKFHTFFRPPAPPATMDDYYDRDSDEYYDSSDENGPFHDYGSDDFPDIMDSNKIFISLEDFSMLNELDFYRDSNDGSLPQETEKEGNYESVCQILEELVILLNVWRKRTQHEFTADIEATLEKKDIFYASSIRYCDYTHLDFDDVFELPRILDPSRPVGPETKINDILTKRKFRQSTRLFRGVFASDEEFENFLQFLQGLKKHLSSIRFELFLDAIMDLLLPQLQG